MPVNDNRMHTIGEEIIVAAHDRTRTGSVPTDLVVEALRVTAVNQVIEGLRLPEHLPDLLTASVSVADNQYLHASPTSFASLRISRIARSAFPLWLMAFFSSGASSAEYRPFSGT